jgi:hypothetical protein
MVTFDSNKASAVLQVWANGKTAELEIITSKYRRRGNAGAVLQKALEYADFLNLEVVLEVQPFGDGVGMRKPELRAWYMTFGFKHEGNDIMSRKSFKERQLLSEEQSHDESQQGASDPSSSLLSVVRRPDGSDGSSGD